MLASLLAPLKVEFKNLWWDFRKVVSYIESNTKWLRYYMETISAI